jgi:hypothetical protein
MAEDEIPRIAHFVYGFRPQILPFDLVHYLAIASCREVVHPDEIFMHCHELPYGFYWDLIRPHVTLRRVDAVPEVTNHAYADPLIEYNAHAHHADFTRLDVLADYGGLYADIDTLFVAPVPDRLWQEHSVLGREGDVLDPATGRSRPSVSNALIMARPGASYIERWHDRIAPTFDGSWSAHSCFLADDLAREFPDEVHVEPQRTFHEFGATAEGLRRLLEDDEPDLEGMVSIHLAAHLWWDEERRDFSPVHGRMIDEAWIRDTACTYATRARRFLPEHDAFR